MSAHTPGPWRIALEEFFDCNYGRKSGAIIGANGQPVVIFDPSEGEYAPALDSDSADARLIAFAPDMLQTLEDLVKYQSSGNVEMTLGAWQRARSLVAMLTGAA